METFVYTGNVVVTQPRLGDDVKEGVARFSRPVAHCAGFYVVVMKWALISKKHLKTILAN